jgi:alkylation response protein AidB-like acyl-CoA dehydrogenase
MNQRGVFYQEMKGKKVWEQSSTGSIMFDNVEVPHEAILGTENDGFKVMVTTLNGGRLFIASLALASLAFALDKTRVYAEERIQFDDKPIGRFQRVQDVIVDMDIALDSGLTWLHASAARSTRRTSSRANKLPRSRSSAAARPVNSSCSPWKSAAASPALTSSA